jgi:DNA repair exonuclease SbcCD ATPase subunit
MALSLSMEGKDSSQSVPSITQAPPPATSEGHLDPAAQKAHLECEKLKAEIASLRKPIWQTAPFYSGVIPALLAAVGLFWTYSSGWFDLQRTRLASEKTLLEAQTERLRADRTTLEYQAREQQTRFARAEDDIQKLRQRESELTNQMAKLVRERDDLRFAKEVLETETKRLAGSDTKAAQFLEQLTSLQAAREQLLAHTQSLQTSNTELRITAARQVALIRWADDVLSEGWATALKDRATRSEFQSFGSHVLRVKAASTPFLPEYQVDPDPPIASDQSQSTSYDNDLRRQAMRSLSTAAKKTYEDYIREAELRFDLLNTPATLNNTNKGTNSLPSIRPP